MIKKVKMILLFVMIALISFNTAFALENEKKETPSELRNLYAKSAVLMDGENGRILFDKKGNEKMPMASTTKIMTLIIALEQGNIKDTVTISKKAASQPKVKLNASAGDKFKLEDLLYSLILESHNDTAVAIAEHIGGSTEKFAGMMNQKARDIGCFDTYFVTPNGLDRTFVDNMGKTHIHSTTAIDLAKIMSYCIKKSPKKDLFLKITRTNSYNFKDIDKKKDYSCNNHNAFLNMMEGALSGKTGFTGDAGYCYVGALKKNNKTLIVALLACGWPNNKSYKWSDTKKLMNYGLENYEFREWDLKKMCKEKLIEIIVIDGQTNRIGETVKINPIIKNTQKVKGLLINKNEKIEITYNIPKKLIAPIKKEQVIGNISYLVNGEIYKKENIISDKEVEKINYKWCIKNIIDEFIFL